MENLTEDEKRILEAILKSVKEKRAVKLNIKSIKKHVSKFDFEEEFEEI